MYFYVLFILEVILKSVFEILVRSGILICFYFFYYYVATLFVLIILSQVFLYKNNYFSSYIKQNYIVQKNTKHQNIILMTKKLKYGRL